MSGRTEVLVRSPSDNGTVGLPPNDPIGFWPERSHRSLVQPVQDHSNTLVGLLEMMKLK